MAGVKLIVIYPRPRDIEAFEDVYQNEHVPLATGRQDQDCGQQGGGFPARNAGLLRIAEIHFPSVAALEACAASEGGKQTIANAVSISSGGPPVFLVAEEQTFTFD